VGRSKLYLYMDVILLLEKLPLMQKCFLDSKQFFGSHAKMFCVGTVLVGGSS
jgi:hypothetical protein